jgi:hypothetical protein
MEELRCNICTEVIDGVPIRLKCNPNLHYFCEECITGWYSELKKNKYKLMYSEENEYIQRMCPICRQDGGLIPLYKKENYIPSIHTRKLCTIKKKKIVEKKVEKKEKKLCTYFINGFIKCKRTGSEKYGGCCYQHENKINDNSDDENEMFEEICNEIKGDKK